MAEFNSTQFNALHVAQQRAEVGLGVRGKPHFPEINYVQAATGAINDTVQLFRAEAPATRLMPVHWIVYVEGWATSTTLSIGHKAYTNRQGTAVAASATAIVSALNIATDGVIVLAANAALQVRSLQLDSRDGVVIFGTFAGANPAAGGILDLYGMHNHG